VKTTSILFLTVLVLCAGLLPALAADSPAVLGILEIRGLDSLSASAFEITKAAGQPMPKEMVSMALYGALGTMPGMGIQPNGTVRALWLDTGTETGGTAVLLPVENEGADYLSGLGQAGWKNETETAEGIEHFTPPEGSGMAWPEVYFLKRGTTLVAGPNADDVRKADAALSSLPPILPVEGDVALQIHPAALVQAFSPQIQEQMDKAFKSNPNTPAEAAAMGDLYMRGYVAFAKQLDLFVLGLGVADGNLNIHTRVVPVADTTLAKWLASIRTPSAAASVVNLPGALFAETAHMGDLNLIGPAYFRYMEALMKLMPTELGAEFTKTYTENAKAIWAQIGGDFGVALLPPTKENPLRAAEYVALKDATALRALTRQMIQSENEMMKAMMGDTNMPAPFKLALTSGEPREYRGIEVDTLSYDLTPSGPLAASWPEEIPTKLAIEMAWVPGGVIASVGDSTLTDTLVDRALDGVSAPLSDLPAWKAAYPTPEDNLVDLSHVALFDILRSYLELADVQTGSSLAANIPAGPGNLESTSYLALGGVMSRVRFSLADIGAIGLKVKEAQEKAMADMMRQMDMQGEMQIEDSGEVMPMGAGEAEETNMGADAQEPEAPTVATPVSAPVKLPAPAPAVAK
jgi:hypothetical protein